MDLVTFLECLNDIITADNRIGITESLRVARAHQRRQVYHLSTRRTHEARGKADRELRTSSVALASSGVMTGRSNNNNIGVSICGYNM